MTKLMILFAAAAIVVAYSELPTAPKSKLANDCDPTAFSCDGSGQSNTALFPVSCGAQATAWSLSIDGTQYPLIVLSGPDTISINPIAPGQHTLLVVQENVPGSPPNHNLLTYTTSFTTGVPLDLICPPSP